MRPKSYLSEGIKLTKALTDDIIFLWETRLKETLESQLLNVKL